MPLSEDEIRRRAAEIGMILLDVDGVLTMDCLVKSDDVAFIATGVTDGEMLRGGCGDVVTVVSGDEQ